MTGKLKYYALLMCGLFILSSGAFANKGKKGWEEMDTNKDGNVTRSEFMSSAEEKFSKMDTNSDGVVSQDEFREKMEKHKGEKKDRY